MTSFGFCCPSKTWNWDYWRLFLTFWPQFQHHDPLHSERGRKSKFRFLDFFNQCLKSSWVELRILHMTPWLKFKDVRWAQISDICDPAMMAYLPLPELIGKFLFLVSSHWNLLFQTLLFEDVKCSCHQQSSYLAERHEQCCLDVAFFLTNRVPVYRRSTFSTSTIR